MIDVEIPIPESNSRISPTADTLDTIRSTIVIGIAQCDERRSRNSVIWTCSLDRHVDVAVLCDSEVSRPAKAVREDGSAESRGDHDLSVVHTRRRINGARGFILTRGVVLTCCRASC